MARNWTAILNAFALLVLYFYLFISLAGWIGPGFPIWIVIIFLVLGFLAELYFLINSFI